MRKLTKERIARKSIRSTVRRLGVKKMRRGMMRRARRRYQELKNAWYVCRL